MARAKKNDAKLTLKEKLDYALVPDWEWPYKLPDGWCWAKQGNVSQFINGRAYKQSELLDDSALTPVLRVGNLFTNSSWYYSDLILDEDKYIDNNDLIYAWSASFGPFIWQGGKVIYHYHIWKVQLANEINKKYFYFWLLNDTERLKTRGHGTGMIHVTKEMMEQAPIPIPPKHEQQRIVDRIESLFAKLDEAKDKAQATLDSFQTRKAAILHKAFSGELTTKWRKEHAADLSEWRKCLLSDVVSEFKYGTSEKSDYNNTGIPVIRIPNIGDDGLDFADLKYLPHNNIETESQIHENDILIIRSNGSRDLVGKSVRVPHLDHPYAYASFLIRIKPTPIVRSDYLATYLNSADARSQMFKKAKSSAGINNINSKELGAITLSLPSTEEQFEIVQILENHISKEQKAKDISEAVLEQIDLIKKAILSRAFRGELGTNDPTDGNAIDLLKRILNGEEAETEIVDPKRKRVSIPQEVVSRLSSRWEKEMMKLFYKEDADTVSISELMSISGKKFELMDALRKLQQKGLIIKAEDGNFVLAR